MAFTSKVARSNNYSNGGNRGGFNREAPNVSVHGIVERWNLADPSGNKSSPDDTVTVRLLYHVNEFKLQADYDEEVRPVTLVNVKLSPERKPEVKAEVKADANGKPKPKSRPRPTFADISGGAGQSGPYPVGSYLRFDHAVLDPSRKVDGEIAMTANWAYRISNDLSVSAVSQWVRTGKPFKNKDDEWQQYVAVSGHPQAFRAPSFDGEESSLLPQVIRLVEDANNGAYSTLIIRMIEPKEDSGLDSVAQITDLRKEANRTTFTMKPRRADPTNADAPFDLQATIESFTMVYDSGSPGEPQPGLWKDLSQSDGFGNTLIETWREHSYKYGSESSAGVRWDEAQLAGVSADKYWKYSDVPAFSYNVYRDPRSGQTSSKEGFGFGCAIAKQHRSGAIYATSAFPYNAKEARFTYSNMITPDLTENLAHLFHQEAEDRCKFSGFALHASEDGKGPKPREASSQQQSPKADHDAPEVDEEFGSELAAPGV